jgi:hypothetical protein
MKSSHNCRTVYDSTDDFLLTVLADFFESTGSSPASRLERTSSHAEIAALYDMAGHSPSFSWRIRLSTGDLNLYIQLLRLVDASIRKPGKSGRMMCAPGASSLAAFAENFIGVAFLISEAQSYAKTQTFAIRRCLLMPQRIFLHGGEPPASKGYDGKGAMLGKAFRRITKRIR